MCVSLWSRAMGGYCLIVYNNIKREHNFVGVNFDKSGRDTDI